MYECSDLALVAYTDLFPRYERLKRENPGKYIHGLNYDSPDFCWLVQRAIDTNGDERISNYEYIRFLIILRSTNSDGWLEGNLNEHIYMHSFFRVDVLRILQSCSGFLTRTMTTILTSTKSGGCLPRRTK